MYYRMCGWRRGEIDGQIGGPVAVGIHGSDGSAKVARAALTLVALLLAHQLCVLWRSCSAPQLGCTDPVVASFGRFAKPTSSARAASRYQQE